MKPVYVVVMDSEYLGTNRLSTPKERSRDHMFSNIVKIYDSREKAELYLKYLKEGLSNGKTLKELIAMLNNCNINDIEIEREKTVFDPDDISDSPMLLYKSVYVNKKRKTVDIDFNNLEAPFNAVESDVKDRYIVEFFIERWEVE